MGRSERKYRERRELKHYQSENDEIEWPEIPPEQNFGEDNERCYFEQNRDRRYYQQKTDGNNTRN